MKHCLKTNTQLRVSGGRDLSPVAHSDFGLKTMMTGQSSEHAAFVRVGLCNGLKKAVASHDCLTKSPRKAGSLNSIKQLFYCDLQRMYPLGSGKNISQ